MFRKQKIGYTLTELLVVVMIIAVLSAVVLPKFSKVLETRKTTEAEDLMTAVRQEQEYRCAADKPYASNASQLQSLANAKTKNFTLSFKEGGIEAAREGKKYKLSIPSYADGRVCCEDINNSGQCAELNKEYPLCSNLKNTSDYEAAPTNCLAEGIGEEEAPSGECENGATQEEACGPSCDRGTRVVKECVNGVWQIRNGECSVADHPCTCEYYTGQQKPANKTQSCNSCGTQTISYSCNETTWQWVPSYGTCVSKVDGTTVINKDADCPRCWEEKLPGQAYDQCTHEDYVIEFGTWNDEACSCRCPSGTALNENGNCERERCNREEYEDSAYRCEGRNLGHWDWNNCECVCDDPRYRINSDGECDLPCDQDAYNACVNPWDVAENPQSRNYRAYAAGHWDMERCQCTCDSPYTLVSTGSCFSCEKEWGDDGTYSEERAFCAEEKNNGGWSDWYGDISEYNRMSQGPCGCTCGPYTSYWQGRCVYDGPEDDDRGGCQGGICW